MLKKQFVRSRNVSKVTFEIADEELPEDVEVQSVHLVGDFNDWDPKATPMKRLKRGAYQAALDLQPGEEYQFRYLVNGEHWCNDWNADAYISTGFGSDNSLVKTLESDVR